MVYNLSRLGTSTQRTNKGQEGTKTKGFVVLEKYGVLKDLVL